MTVASAVDLRLAELGIELPTPGTPGANYVQTARVGSLLFVTGQLCQWNGERRFIGKLGRELNVAAGQEAARLCALNLIAHVRAALDGNLDHVVRCVRLRGFVNCTPEFEGHSQVMNGASDLLVRVFGERGRHTRTAVGVNGLPYGVAVETEATFEVEG
jgi:enamine deaminase RidA (YjgF/YER057c/UK114 family)